MAPTDPATRAVAPLMDDNLRALPPQPHSLSGPHMGGPATRYRQMETPTWRRQQTRRSPTPSRPICRVGERGFTKPPPTRPIASPMAIQSTTQPRPVNLDMALGPTKPNSHRAEIQKLPNPTEAVPDTTRTAPRSTQDHQMIRQHSLSAGQSSSSRISIPNADARDSTVK